MAGFVRFCGGVVVLLLVLAVRVLLIRSARRCLSLVVLPRLLRGLRRRLVVLLWSRCR